jgi:hypothetical protein
MKRTIVAGAVLALAGIRAGAESTSPSPWLHIRVEESDRQSKVHVNLPLPVVEVALKAAPATLTSHGKIHLGPGGKNLSLADMRKMWAELKASGDVDLVTVEDKDENVKVARKGDLVLVKVERLGKEEVNVEVPVSLVDALFSTEGEELNVKAALLELQKRRGDIVRVNDANSKVRVWIDEKN